MSNQENGARDGAKKRRSRNRGPKHRYAALDLGTNNCRLLIAAPSGKSLRIIDAFSRIVRLGEGLTASGVLSEDAMGRTMQALSVCADKINARDVSHMRCIATQACRSAANGEAFLAQVREQTGLPLEIITAEEEARLAAAGCMDLIDREAKAALIFDIGGGSTEISWIVQSDGGMSVVAWTSLPLGVVSLSEKWDGGEISAETYEAIVQEVRNEIAAAGDPAGVKPLFEADDAHLLGTSGTVTSIAGVHLALERYRRDRIDGVWLSIDEARGVTEKLRLMSLEDRANEPCVGRERADLVVCGCAILDALAREWPATRVRVADRGLREGILADLAQEAKQQAKKRRRRRRKPKTKTD